MGEKQELASEIRDLSGLKITIATDDSVIRHSEIIPWVESYIAEELEKRTGVFSDNIQVVFVKDGSGYGAGEYDISGNVTIYFEDELVGKAYAFVFYQEYEENKDRNSFVLTGIELEFL